MTLWQLAWRNLRRRPLRATFSVIGIGLSVGTAIALLSLSGTIARNAEQSVEERGADLTMMQTGTTDFMGSFLPDKLGRTIAAVPGVAGVAPELIMFAPVAQHREILVLGWPRSSYFWDTVPLSSGRLPRSGERKVALLGDEAAAALGKRPGDELTLFGLRFRIVGVARYQTGLNRSMVVLLLPDLQEAAYRTGQVTLFNVRLTSRDSAAVAAVRARLAGLGASVSLTSELLRGNRYVETMRAISLVTSAIAIAIGILNILNTLIFTVQERTREIGILAAIGWSERLIATSIVIEGMILCVAGSVLGVALGHLASQLFRAIPIIGSVMRFTPTIGLTLETVSAAMLLCLLGSLYPAVRAVRLSPADALRRA